MVLIPGIFRTRGPRGSLVSNTRETEVPDPDLQDPEPGHHGRHPGPEASLELEGFLTFLRIHGGHEGDQHKQ